MLKNNDWIILNAITYKIHSVEDMDEMRLSIMNQIKYLFDFDGASFYLASAVEAKKLERPVGIHYDVEDMNAYLNQFKSVDYSEGLMFTGKNITYRESDLVPDEIRINTEYYQAVYDKQGWHYSLHLNISYEDEFLGILSFFRNKGKEDFHYDDIFALDMLKDHLALRLYGTRMKEKKKKITITQCGEKYGLSAREEMVLVRLLHDATAEEIANELTISVSTLRKHCNHIYKKIGVGQRIQLYDMIEV